jgi:hypothetical protein
MAPPPTIEAVTCQIYRVYLQVQDWLGLALSPEDWGFAMVNGAIVPVPTTKDAIAPEGLLKFIKCSCKGNCASNRCGCYKLGVTCTECCAHCKGEHCDNHVEGSGNGTGLATQEEQEHDEPDHPTTAAGFAQYVDTDATDDNMESLRAYSESRGWDWQDVLVGSTEDDAEDAAGSGSH